MNAPESGSDSANQRFSMLFQTLLAQQVNMALVCLGQAPGEDGQKKPDLEGARFFIDLIEMLDVKTAGNLTPQEQSVLKQSLTSLRLAFVQLTNKGAPKTPSAPSQTLETSAPSPTAPEKPASTPEEAESRKKFTKKY